MAKAVLQCFEDYQKARISFVQTIATLSTHQQNVDALYSAGVIPLLKPLLLDVVPSIQQSAALAIGRLSSYSEDLAKCVADNDIVSQLIYSLPKQNRFFKKAACYVLKSVAQHSVELAQSVVDSGAVEPLVNCLNEYDPSIKEAAAFALGHIAKHNEHLAHQVVEARAVDSLLLCLQEPEIILKRVSSQTLAYICQHTEQLSQPVVENGLDIITKYLNYTDTAIKRNVCNLLTNICKHSAELATHVLSKIVHPQKLLNCLKDNDSKVRNSAANCICQIVSKTPETAAAIYSAGAPQVIVEYISKTKSDAKLYGILSLAYIGQYKDEYAMKIINSGAVDVLKEALNTGNDQIKCSACFCLNHLGRHSPEHANIVSKSGVLEIMLFYYKNENTSNDLKEKARNAINEIISKCDYLTALEPLLYISCKEILKNVLTQFVTYLKGNQKELSNFARNGGLQKVLEIKPKVDEPLLHLTEEICSYYPQDIINYYSPGYARQLLEQIGVVTGEEAKNENQDVIEEKKDDKKMSPNKKKVK